LSPYALSKQLGEGHCQYYSSAFGLKTGVYRLFSAYGPGLRRQLVFDIVQRLRSDPARLEMLGTGDEGRDLSYVWDHANAIRGLSRAVTPQGDIFNIGTGCAHSVRGVVELICSLLCLKPRIIFNGQHRNFEAEWWCADVGKLRAAGIQPRYTLEEGLRETVTALSGECDGN
jgi:nucleoside-diphosphate-sugar epimerase